MDVRAHDEVASSPLQARPGVYGVPREEWCECLLDRGVDPLVLFDQVRRSREHHVSYAFSDVVGDLAYAVAFRRAHTTALKKQEVEPTALVLESIERRLELSDRGYGKHLRRMPERGACGTETRLNHARRNR